MKAKTRIYFYKIIRYLCLTINFAVSTLYGRILLFFNGVTPHNVRCYGFPIVNVSLAGELYLGYNVMLRSYANVSDTGGNMPSKITVRGKGKLIIGNNVGITSSLICCWDKITIGDNVKIGGANRIFDTNFHSLNPDIRSSTEDEMQALTSPITIGDNVFIGTSCIIGKGISIGENSVIAAGSVVTCNIPANEVWGGNPAKFIKKI